MTKNQKMLLGVGAVAVVGYLVYKQMNKSKGFNGQIFAPSSSSAIFTNATGRGATILPGGAKYLAMPCDKNDGSGGSNDMCCKAKSCTGGKCQCCRGGEASGAKSMGCGAGTVATTTTGSRMSSSGY